MRGRLPDALARTPLPPQAVASPQETSGFRGVTRPLWILAAVAVLVVLRVGREVLVPLLLAVLLALVLSGIVEALRRYRIPRGVSALVLLAAGVLAIGFGVDALRAPAQSWVQSAPKVLRTIEHRVRPARTVVLRLNDIAVRAAALAGGPRASAPAAPEPVASVTTMGVLEQTGSRRWAPWSRYACSRCCCWPAGRQCWRT